MKVDTRDGVALEGTPDVDAVFAEIEEDTPEEIMALKERPSERTDVSLEGFQPELPSEREPQEADDADGGFVFDGSE